MHGSSGRSTGSARFRDVDALGPGESIASCSFVSRVYKQATWCLTRLGVLKTSKSFLRRAGQKLDVETTTYTAESYSTLVCLLGRRPTVYIHQVAIQERDRPCWLAQTSRLLLLFSYQTHQIHQEHAFDGPQLLVQATLLCLSRWPGAACCRFRQLSTA